MARQVAALLDAVTARQRALARRRATRGRKDAPDFSIFQFSRTDEIGLSRLICWLLDPVGNHNQGATFLETFFETFGIDRRGLAVLERACARPEVATHSIKSSRRRMDIEVRCPGFTLAIENKPYAGFQHRQLSDYCAHLENVSAGAYALVVLKGSAQHIPKAQLRPDLVEDGRLIDSTYAELAAWLRCCAQRCEAKAVAAFLRQFEAFIQTEFLTGATMEEQSMILKELEAPARKRAALDLIAAADDLYEALHAELHSALKRRSPHSWTISDDTIGRDGRFDNVPYYLTFDFGDDVPVLLCFDSYTYDSTALVSVRPRARLKSMARRLKFIGEKLRSQFPASGRSNESWLWWARHGELLKIEALELADPNIWKAMIDPSATAGNLIQLAKNFEEAIRAALKDCARRA